MVHRVDVVPHLSHAGIATGPLEHKDLAAIGGVVAELQVGNGNGSSRWGGSRASARTVTHIDAKPSVWAMAMVAK